VWVPIHDNGILHVLQKIQSFLQGRPGRHALESAFVRLIQRLLHLLASKGLITSVSVSGAASATKSLESQSFAAFPWEVEERRR